MNVTPVIYRSGVSSIKDVLWCARSMSKPTFTSVICPDVIFKPDTCPADTLTLVTGQVDMFTDVTCPGAIFVRRSYVSQLCLRHFYFRNTPVILQLMCEDCRA